ncbi:hypothetical protein ACFX13_047790 [Malus domestica]
MLDYVKSNASLKQFDRSGLYQEKKDGIYKEVASEQQQRRENTTPEREVYIEKDKVPKMTTHFEALTVHAADTKAGRKDTSLDSSSKQSSQHDDKLASMRSGNTVGDVGMGKARETYEFRSHKLESLRDTQASTRDDGQRELQADKVEDKEAESKKKSQGGGGQGQGGTQGQSLGKLNNAKVKVKVKLVVIHLNNAMKLKVMVGFKAELIHLNSTMKSVRKFEVSSGEQEKQVRINEGRESSEINNECRRTQIHEGVEKMTLRGEDNKLQGQQKQQQQASKEKQGFESERKSTQESNSTQETKRSKEQPPSLEEVSQKRGTALQNFVEVIVKDNK